MIRTVFAASFAAFVALSLTTPAQASGSGQDVVRGSANDKVVNTFGSCVRTKWDAENDLCAAPKAKPEPVAEPAPAPAPKAPEISSEQRTIYFDYKKSDISPKGKEKLDTLAGMIRNSSNIKEAKVVGYTDDIGGSDYNVKLSERRADAVNRYLASRINIPTEVLEVRGLGKSNPTTDCPAGMKKPKRIECLAKDRRVEVELVYEK